MSSGAGVVGRQLDTGHATTMMIGLDAMKMIAHAQLVVIADAHHATPLEHPHEFNSVLAQFLARHP